jgi:hypothetical protein
VLPVEVLKSETMCSDIEKRNIICGSLGRSKDIFHMGPSTVSHHLLLSQVLENLDVAAQMGGLTRMGLGPFTLQVFDHMVGKRARQSRKGISVRHVM